MNSGRVLVFRIGSLGDTIVSLPAMWAAKDFYSNAHFTLLCDQQSSSRMVLAADLLRGSGLFDDYLTYPVDASAGRWEKALSHAKLLWTIRRQKFDTLIYLAPSARTPAQVDRDRRFFRLAGITRTYGMTGEFGHPPEIHPLPTLPTEAELLLARLRDGGMKVPSPAVARVDLGINALDEAEFEAWLERQPHDGGRPWVGVGPGSKMPAKIWPGERFAEVLSGLIAKYDVWPVIFGGKEDLEVGKLLIDRLGRGTIAAGGLGLRSAAVGLSRCRLYLGNDTGTMHIAATVKTPCVAIFSARTFPGLWYPYGNNHRVIRHQVTCEGCELVVCVKEKMRCLMGIDPSEVLIACERAMDSSEPSTYDK